MIAQDLKSLPRSALVDGRLLVLVAFAAIVVTRAIPLTHDYDPWIDEAMLIANLETLTLTGLFEPLPLFEQAAPLGYLVSIALIYGAFDDPANGVMALRVFSGFVTLAGAGAMYLLGRSLGGRALGILTLALVALPPVATAYALEIKHYPMEIAASAFMLCAAHRQVNDPSRRSLAILAAAGLFTVLFTFTAPVILVATLAPVGLMTLWGAGRNGLSRPAAEALAVCACILGLMGLFYLAYTGPVTEIQFAGWAHVYEGQYLGLTEVEHWVRLFALVSHMTCISGAIPLGVWHAVFLCLATLGLVELFRRSPYVFFALTLCVAVVVVLSLLHLLPVVFARHFVFMFAPVGLVLACGCMAVLRAIVALARVADAHRWHETFALMIFVPLATLALLRADAAQHRENVSPLIAYIDGHPDGQAPVWVYFGAQPVMQVMAPRDMHQIGLVSHRSRVPGWFNAQLDFPREITSEAYFRSFAEHLAGLDSVFLVFTHFWHEPMGPDGQLGRFRALATEAVGRCRDVDLPGRAVLWYCDRPT